MPKFTPMRASEVVFGRAARAREPFVAALREGEAGRIELARGERPGRIKRYLRLASKDTGIRVRSSWKDAEQRTLLWKRVGGETQSSRPRRGPGRTRR